MSKLQLVLWDIDHTLIETGGVGREVFGAAFQAATGIPMRDMVHASGHTEPQLFSETLEMHGIEEQPHHFETFARVQAEEYHRHAGALRSRGRVLPGAASALRQLAEHPTIVQSVLTGNTRAAAIAKLQAFGIADALDLDIGAYGDDNTDRAELVRIAQDRAASKHNVEFDRESTVLVGDTVRDVAAGHDGGARVIAVTSGSTSADELREANPEIVVPDLSDVVDTLVKDHDIRQS
ncbi:HAD family hydrolase [Allonocardiopsis opalescens]|uniref:HAD family hydrolase n=1 Tax=Allonocardiopsis opalescens TaxID=1144618 RepID=UPI000D071950|nr:HAD hydrolase-like protein [Allonocardiopsis opalescens]